MNRHRPRAPRQDGAALQLLVRWRVHVEDTEHRVRLGGRAPLRIRSETTRVTGCPACDGEIMPDSRARLESLIRNGGRRAHRLAAEVTRLDNRYRDATVEYSNRRSVAWWNRRIPWV